MSIYEMKKSDLVDLLRRFAMTEYGKIQFLISYSIPFISFFIMIILFVMVLLVSDCYTKVISLFLFAFTLLCLISFIIGSAHYYNELRLYSLDKKKKGISDLWKKF